MRTVLGGLVDEWTWYVLCSSYSAGPHRDSIHLISLPLQVMFIVTALLLASTYHGDFGIMMVIHALISLGVVGYFERLILNSANAPTGHAQCCILFCPSLLSFLPSSINRHRWEECGNEMSWTSVWFYKIQAEMPMRHFGPSGFADHSRG